MDSHLGMILLALWMVALSGKPAECTSGYKPLHGTQEEYLKCLGLTEEECEYVEAGKRILEQRAGATAEKQNKVAHMSGKFSAASDSLGFMAHGIKEDLKHHGTDEMSLPIPPCDELITPAKMKTLLDESRRRKRRKVKDLTSSLDAMKWDTSSPIKHALDTSYPNAHKRVIRTATAAFEKNTCIRFKEVSPSKLQAPGLLFVNGGTGCGSYVGRLKNRPNPQPITLPGACMYFVGIAMHEIMHALGVYHEHQQIGRDEYVSVFQKNSFLSQSSWDRHFSVESSTDNLGVPYDINSVMHYSATSFSSNRAELLTVVPKQLDNLYNIGQRAMTSFEDFKVINRLYCDDICSTPTDLPCSNGGYQDTNDCTKCICPNAWQGDDCSQPADNSNGCSPRSSTVDFIGPDTQCFQSPGYDKKNMGYKPGDKCYWQLQAPPGCNLHLWFPSTSVLRLFSLEFTCHHWVEIKYKYRHHVSGQRFCVYDWKHNESNKMVSDGSKVMVEFEANDVVGYTPSNHYTKGFQLCAAIGECGVVQWDMEEESAIVTSTSTTTSAMPLVAVQAVNSDPENVSPLLTTTASKTTIMSRRRRRRRRRRRT